VTGKDKELLRTLGKLPRFRTRTINEPVFDGELFFMEAGPKDGQRVVMVHGIGDNGAFDWSSLFSGLAHHYRVLALDLPGFGRSTKANQLYSPDNYVKLVKWLAETQVEDRFNLIGHSMGGAISLLYAGTHGLDLQRLVLVDVAGVMHRHAFGEYMMRLGISNIPVLDEVAGDAISWLAHNLARPFFRREPDPSMVLKVAKVRQKLLKGDPEKIAALTLMFKNMGAAIDGGYRDARPGGPVRMNHPSGRGSLVEGRYLSPTNSLSGYRQQTPNARGATYRYACGVRQPRSISS